MPSCYRSLAVAAAVAAVSGCSPTYTNPFNPPTHSAAPPASAALIFTTDKDTTAGYRELYAINADGSGLTRLTFFNETGPSDVMEAAPAPDRLRAALRRRNDTDGDGRLTNNDGIALVHVNLANAIEGQLTPPTSNVSDVDWSRAQDTIVFAAAGTGGLEDLYRIDSNGLNLADLTSSDAVRERRTRIDPSGAQAVYEYLPSTPGKSQIWLFSSSIGAITTGGPGTDELPGTGYVVGSDTDADFAPDGTKLVFRRLTGIGNGGLGTWDLLTTNGAQGVAPAPVVTGPLYRGAPDWGTAGIAFVENDGAAGTWSLVVVQPDGSGRKVLLTVSGGKQISAPRWLPTSATS